MSSSPVRDLMTRVRSSLADAYAAPGTAERHLAASVAVLRAATAVVTVRGGGLPGTRPTDPWALLVRLAPELAEWADYFALVADRGIELAARRAPVRAREADDLLRAAEAFVGRVSQLLGQPCPPQGPGRLPPVPVTIPGGRPEQGARLAGRTA